MAVAYAALVSLTHTIDQIFYPPPHHQFIFDKDQIESVREKAGFLISRLNDYSSTGCLNEIEHLGKAIADAASTAEHIIVSNVMNQIVVGSAVNGEETSNLLFSGVQKAIEEFLIIEKELLEIQNSEQPINTKTVEASSSSPPTGGENSMVGFDVHVKEMMSALFSGGKPPKIHSLVGMGGIGKTTLATHVFYKPLVVEKFHVRAFVTISQEYIEKDILLCLINQIQQTNRDEKEMNDGDELGTKLHKSLLGRKYLIVIDDIWDTRAWEMVKMFLPDNDNGSRILITTRLLDLAVDIGSCSPYKLNFLTKAQSWDLLHKKLFTEGRCAVELKGIGKSIANKCRGLPLALVVIGGVLENSKTEEHWVSIEKNVTSEEVNNEDDKFCMKILLLSYNHLPIYLKPCFLYFVVFPEDCTIQVSKLVRLWVAEGFIKKDGQKSLEEIGEKYLNDLIDKNLILADRRELTGQLWSCRIHPLLSDVCRREAQKENFILTGKLYDLNYLTNTKVTPRLDINGGKWKGTNEPLVPTRSFLSFYKGGSTDYTTLRIFDVVDGYPKYDILQLINSKYVAFTGSMLMPSTISRLWSLQTLVVDGVLILPSEIWQMPQLRHVQATLICMHDPPPDDVHKIILLESLQTLSRVKDFKCCEKVIQRIPNLKKLEIICGTIGSNSLSNLRLLHKLEQLYLKCPPCGGAIGFPSSLKDLTLCGCKIPWENMSIVGSLLHLEVLKLRTYAAAGQKWISKEREFTRLKYLLIHQCELEIWEAENTHFPCLEILHLGYLNLKKIPLELAEIAPLRLITLDHNSSNDLLASANKISEERIDLEFVALRVRNCTVGVLGIWVKRCINLDVGGIEDNKDRYVVITSGKKSVETIVVTKDVKRECDEQLTILHPDQSRPVFLTVYDHNEYSMGNKMGVADFDIKPLVEAAKMNLDVIPTDTTITKILPTSSNCLYEESSIIWKNGKIIQDICLRLKNVECGEIELQLEWIDTYRVWQTRTSTHVG